MTRASVGLMTLALFGQATLTGCVPGSTPGPLPERGTIVTTAATDRDTAAYGQTVVLSATVAADVGDVSYAWMQISGPGVQLIQPTSRTTRFTALSLDSPQMLRFRVTTHDGAGAVGSADVAVLVKADPLYGERPPEDGATGDRPPVARAGRDRQVEEGAQVTLDGSGSTGSGLTFNWRQTLGTTVVTNDPNSATSQFYVNLKDNTALDQSGSNAGYTVFGRIFAGMLIVDTIAEVPTTRRGSYDDVPVQDVVIETIRRLDPDERTRVRVTTTNGHFDIELDPEKAPKSVENFLQYVDDGFYEGTLIHRVIPDFVIQGGGLLPGGVEKEPRDPIESEADNGLKNVRGAVGMALLSVFDRARVTFSAPAFVTGGDNRLEFELKVTDAENREATDRVFVTITRATTDGGGTGTTERMRVRVTTTKGQFDIELDAEKAPKSVENFLQYVDDGFYEGTLIHRVIPDFVIQGGGLEPGGVEKEPRDPIESEADNGLKNVRGAVGMARTDDPNSATSQFYVNLKDNTALDQSGTNAGYTVFGRISAGMLTVDTIAEVPTTSRGSYKDVPVRDVVIETIRRLDPDDNTLPVINP